jgi:DNA-binding transcriptional ArsR family regulator
MTEDDWIHTLRALADKTRLGIIRVLLDRDLTVTELSAQLDVPQYNISKHLRVLREARIIEARKCGAYTHCRLAHSFRRRVSPDTRILDLGCCVFRFDELR